MREKIFEYIEPKDPQQGDWEPVIIRKTGNQILNEYYPYWSEQMDKKYGVGRNRTNDINDCIEDFCTVNWANEVN